MKTVGVRELREHASEILREVQGGEIVNVTNRGTIVARLVPARPPALSDEEIEEILSDLEAVSAEVTAQWPRGLSVQEVMDDVRR
jgi:prevent-host-death family protein